jgi:threonine/homoserine/homoserine lactone efflux protein
MEQLLIIALAHFLALLSPGPDFFLVARTSISGGWRIASGACLGIALANGAFIAMAFTGLSILREGSPLFIGLQLAGAAYLLYIGTQFLRHAGRSSLAAVAGNGAVPGWWRSVVLGFLSGILNPKNALFYASLASMVASSSVGWKVVYACQNQRVLQRFARTLPWLERASGVMLIVLAVGLALHLARG